MQHDPRNAHAPARGARGAGAELGRGQQPHCTTASAEPLLQRLDGVQRSGNGWRARCPSCEGRSRKLSVAESGDRVLVHCFGGCAAIDVLQAVGLSWADIMPPRSWPESPDERRRARRAMRECGWSAALQVLALESRIVHLAAREIWMLGGLGSIEDGKRLALAVERIASATTTLTEAANWRPGRAA